MNSNVGKSDRVARLVAGVVLLGLVLFSGMPLFESELWKAVIAVVGIVLIATATMRFCPLYRLLGVNTCKL